MRNDLHEDNRRSWNEATRAYNSHRGNQVTLFRNGGSTLYPEELELLGDIRGRSVVHLLLTAVVFRYLEQAFLLLLIENDHCGSLRHRNAPISAHATRDASVTSPTLYLFRKPDHDFKLSGKTLGSEKHRRQSHMPLKHYERTFPILPNQDQSRKPGPRAVGFCHLENPLIAYPKHFVSSQDILPCITNTGFSANDEGVKQAMNATQGFTFLLAGLKAFLEHKVTLHLSADSHPEEHS